MSEEQDTTFQDNLAILYMAFSVPSIIGSVYIMQTVLKSKRRRGSVFHRLMLGMASIDFVYGLYTLFGPIALPAPDQLDGFVVNSFARGSWKAYNAISYVGQAARIASILYNGTLTIYYLLTIRFRWTEQKSRRVEVWFHIIPIVSGMVTATVAISLGMFTDTPFGCTVAIQDSEDEQNTSFNLILFLCLIWLVFIEIFVSMVMIYRSIRKIEQKANQWKISSFELGSCNSVQRGLTYTQEFSKNTSERCKMSVSGSTHPRVDLFPSATAPAGTHETNIDIENRGKLDIMRRSILRRTSSLISNSEHKKIDQSKIFAGQALLYGFAYLATFLLPSVHVVIYLWIPSLATGQVFVTVAYMNAFFSTMQGFWNACIYARPALLAKRRRKQELKEKECRREERRVGREHLQLYNGSSPDGNVHLSSSPENSFGTSDKSAQSKPRSEASHEGVVFNVDRKMTTDDDYLDICDDPEDQDPSQTETTLDCEDGKDGSGSDTEPSPIDNL